MKNTTQMRERLAEARAVLRGDAVAAVPVMSIPVYPQMQFASGANTQPLVGARYILERWRPHD